MRFVLVFLLASFAWSMPCGTIDVACSSVPPGYVGLCLGDYRVLGAYVDYGYGNVSFQSFGISCDFSPSGGGLSSGVVLSPSDSLLLSSFWHDFFLGFGHVAPFVWALFGIFIVIRIFHMVLK